jgi:hypothetical protein
MKLVLFQKKRDKSNSNIIKIYYIPVTKKKKRAAANNTTVKLNLLIKI